jgi:hypothetical protein
VASLTAPSGYDRVWSSNLALTQGRCFRWLHVQPYCLIKARLRRGRGYPHVCQPSGTYSGSAR